MDTLKLELDPYEDPKPTLWQSNLRTAPPIEWLAETRSSRSRGSTPRGGRWPELLSPVLSPASLLLPRETGREGLSRASPPALYTPREDSGRMLEEEEGEEEDAGRSAPGRGQKDWASEGGSGERGGAGRRVPPQASPQTSPGKWSEKRMPSGREDSATKFSLLEEDSDSEEADRGWSVKRASGAATGRAAWEAVKTRDLQAVGGW